MIFLDKINKPKLSIGLPVYNGENYLDEALNSILNQTYSDFELIISDNASTDKTSNICHEFASKDKRIKYFRNNKNLGAASNFNRVFELSSCEYFKWAAHDDLHAPDFLEKCVNVLEKDPTIVLCHTRTVRIGEKGEILGNYDYRTRGMRISSYNTHERFGDMISFRNPCWWIFGVIRSDMLKLTGLHRPFAGSDINLLAEISLLGRLYEIPEYLFLRRDHSQAYTKKYVDLKNLDYREKLAWWSTKTAYNDLGSLTIIIEYYNSLRRLPLKWSVKILCYVALIKFLVKEGWYSIAKSLESFLMTRSNLGSKLIPLFRFIWVKIINPLLAPARSRRARVRKLQVQEN